MRYLRTMKATEFKFQELEFSTSRTKVKFFRLRRRLEQEDKKIALRKLSRKSETARRDVINIPTKRKIENNCNTSHTEAMKAGWHG